MTLLPAHLRSSAASSHSLEQELSHIPTDRTQSVSDSRHMGVFLSLQARALARSF